MLHQPLMLSMTRGDITRLEVDAVVTADFSSLDDVRRLADEVLEKHPKLDVLVNNAGVFKNDRTLTKDGFETTFQVNHLTPFLLTHLLLPATSPDVAGKTGGYCVRSRSATPSTIARDASAQKKLFDLSLKMVGLAMLLFVVACKTPPVEDKSQAAEPRATTQSLVDKWAKVDPKTLPSGPADLMKGRPVLVITIDPLPRAYEPGLPGSCFASRADDVGLVVIAKARREPTHLTKTSVGLHDKTWIFDAIAVPDGKLVASWTRFSAAEEPQTVTGSRTNNGTRLTQMDAFAPFPRAAFDTDCSALQAGIIPAQD